MKAAPVLVVVCALALLTACGGNGHHGVPSTLPLAGAPPIAVSQLTTAASQLCAIDRQSHTSPATVLGPFYAGPHNSLHLLAAVANPDHHDAATNLLNVMLVYESAIAAKPPPSDTGQDADALVQAVDAALQALGVPPVLTGPSACRERT